MYLSRKSIVGSAALGAAFVLAQSGGATTRDLSTPRDKLAVWPGRWNRHGEFVDTRER
jgi:hypothetical protein